MTHKDILYTRYEIEDRIRELAKEIAHAYKGQELQLIAVVNGGVMVCADLLRELWALGFERVRFDTVKVSSYGHKTETSGKPQLIKDIRLDIADKPVLIVEDIVDTGLTLSSMREYLLEKGPASLEIMALLSKPDSVRLAEVDVKYVGFHIENVWVEGYGIDSREYGRGNPNIMQVVTEGA